MQDAAPCSGKLLEAINRDFGSLDELQAKMSADSAAVQVCWTAYTLRAHAHDCWSSQQFTLDCTGQCLNVPMPCRAQAGAGWQSRRRPASCMC